MPKTFTVLAWALPALCLAAPILADDAALSLDALDQRLKNIEQKLDAPSTPKSDAVISAGGGGFSISSADKAYSLKFGGLVQADSRNFFEDQLKPQSNNETIRRARVIIDAGLGPKAKLRLQQDIGTGLIVDAYGELKLAPGLNLRLGLFKTPLSLERWRSDPARDFVELGYTTDLVTDRDTGAWLEWSDADQALFIGAGAFNGSVDSSAVVTTDTDDDKDFEAKLFVHPFRYLDSVKLRDLGLGVAYSSGNRGTGTPPTGANQFRPLGQGSGFYSLSNTATADGNGQRLIPQAYLYLGSLSFLGEYVRETQAYRILGLPASQLSYEAWQTQLGWVLTGEDASFGGVKLGPNSHDWGALQAVCRVQGLNFDQESFYRYDAGGATATEGAAQGRLVDPRSSASAVFAWGLGLNYYPVNNVKLLLDWEESHYTDGAKTGSGASTQTVNRETEKVLLGRAQFAF